MARPELGTKRQCGSCGAKFYDLNRDPIKCPKCDATFEPVVVAVRAAPVAAAPKKAVVAEVVAEATPDDVEVVSLEDVEASDDDVPDIEDVVLADDDDDDDDDLESSDSDTFLEDDDDDPDVSDILGTDISKDKEET